ncbi:exodeoxyribonuclease-like [Watersipora subatra]|uniref:exodeoxyribonuclease-like n=1 Tax=Watersipora subatra TaxID=2589382 RepID=UPI00355B048F
MPKRKATGDAGAEVSPAKSKKAEGSEGQSDACLDALDFSSDASTKSGVKWNKKFISMNVNGFRAFLKKGGIDYIKKEEADVLCIQETKCTSKEIPVDELKEAGFTAHFLSGDKSGYSGVGIIYKDDPIAITEGINIEKHDGEGRVITAEFENYYLVTVYVPNSGRGLARIDYRTKEWDVDFREYLKELDKKKPVVLCGDLNVAHQEIDLKNPKSNKNKTPGFCDSEREGLTQLLDEGFLDTFRLLYPKKEHAYSFWSYMGNAREKNVGWRLDYFLISNRLEDKLCDSFMRTDVKGSDHCPVGLLMAL